jgi:restriction endonuclease S subunit
MSKYKRYERYKDSGIEWIGEIPEHWEFRRISHICALGRGRVISKIEIAENEGEYPVYSSQTENNGVLGYINTYDFEGDYITWTTDGANAGTVFRRTGRFNCTNVCGTLKSKENNLDLSYLTYALSLETKRYVRLDINPKLMNNEMAKIRVLFPPSDEQIAIANFLDQKTAEIDGLIADKEKLIELLQEKRQAIITEAVTKGLNPNVRMKDSGIEWIGEIPEHWNLRRIRYLANIRNVKASDSDIDKTYVGLENIESKTGKLLTNGDDEQQFVGETANIFKKGDVLFGKLRPYLAKCIIADFDGRCTSELLVLKTTSYILPKYLHFFMLSPKFIDVVNSSTYGAKMPRASWDFIGNLEIPLPSIKEQEDIVEYLTEFISRIDDLISDINTQIQKLKEYRQSLISEAVTGKIDVRDYVVSN